MLNTNLVVIELTDEETVPYFNNEQEISNFLNKMNINLPKIDDQDAFPTCSESYKYSTLEHKLWMAILSGITGSVWWRVWLNPENGYVIAYEDYEGKKFTDNFIRYVENVPASNTGDLPCNIGKNIVNNNNGLSLDSILEKIFSQGLGALTMEEVNFLGDISKDL